VRGKKSHSQKRSLRERGQALVEFALVVPIFLILVFGIVDFGLGLKAWISVTNSAREGARLGALSAGCDAIKQKAVSTSPGLAPPLTTSDVTVLVSPEDLGNCTGHSGDELTVTVEYDYDYITPLGPAHVVHGQNEA
jgi:Flp pilus assembly protein TadG